MPRHSQLCLPCRCCSAAMAAISQWRSWRGPVLLSVMIFSDQGNRTGHNTRSRATPAAPSHGCPWLERHAIALAWFSLVAGRIGFYGSPSRRRLLALIQSTAPMAQAGETITEAGRPTNWLNPLRLSTTVPTALAKTTTPISRQVTSLALSFDSRRPRTQDVAAHSPRKWQQRSRDHDAEIKPAPLDPRIAGRTATFGQLGNSGAINRSTLTMVAPQATVETERRPLWRGRTRAREIAAAAKKADPVSGENYANSDSAASARPQGPMPASPSVPFGRRRLPVHGSEWRYRRATPGQYPWLIVADAVAAPLSRGAGVAAPAAVVAVESEGDRVDA